MNSRDVFAGMFLFIAGAATAFAIAYRKQIAIYMRLSKDGTVEDAANFAAAGEALYKKLFKPPVKK